MADVDLLEVLVVDMGDESIGADFHGGAVGFAEEDEDEDEDGEDEDPAEHGAAEAHVVVHAEFGFITVIARVVVAVGAIIRGVGAVVRHEFLKLSLYSGQTLRAAWGLLKTHRSLRR